MIVAFALLMVVLSLVSLACWILVLIKMFSQSILTGILGLICGLYALVWGFMNMDAAGLRTVMFVWIVTFVATIAIQVALTGMGMTGALGLPTPPPPMP